MKSLKHCTYCFLCFLLAFGAQAQWPAGGIWFKIAITQNGVYKVDRAWLKANGISTDKLHPDKIRFFASFQKLLPQSNSAENDAELTEIPVYSNNKDNTFDKDDYLLFYAEDPNETIFTGTNLSHKKHPYSNENYVFMQLNSAETSKKITASQLKELPTIEIGTLAHFEFYEPEFSNVLNSGREWLGEYFFSEFKKEFNIIGRDLSKPVSLFTKVVSQTYEDTQVLVKTAFRDLGTIDLKLINYRWNDYFKRYNRAGEISQGEFLFENAQEPISLTYQLPQDIDISSGVYLDYIELFCQRKIAFYPSQHQGYYLKQESSFFSIPELKESQFIWDVSRWTNPEILSKTTKNQFTLIGNPNFQKLAFFDLSNTLKPDIPKSFSPIDITKSEVPNLLIVYPEYFKKEAELLADFRKNFDKLDVLTVPLRSVYNQYSGGKTDPTAIRNFCKDLWKKDPSKFKYLLLFGDTNFDPKNNNGINYIFPERMIPTYESRESLEPIYSFSSDDYFGFLEDHEGEWPEGESVNGRWQSTTNNDHSLDISVGRLPVKDRLEAQRVVEKLMHYSSSTHTMGSWKRNISFIADDADLNIHQRDAEKFSELSLQQSEAIKASKIYLDAFVQTKTELGERAPEANKAFEETIKKGAFIVNYNGHGSEDGWTDEKLLTIDQIVRWTNFDRMPILFTATCEFGRYDNPAVVSGAELALLNPDGGAIALLTTTRPVFSSTNFKINQAFYENLFKNDSTVTRLGDLFKVTKNNSIEGEVNRNFSLLGDPSMALTYPKTKITLESINDSKPIDYQIKGLSKVRLKGKVESTKFNGFVYISLFDKPTEKSTLGNATNSKMLYSETENKLYEGRVKVVNSDFETEFIVPKNIDQKIGNGQLFFYAVNADSTQDAIGGNKEFLLGEIENDTELDREGPQVNYIFDQNNSLLTLYVQDESGINLSSIIEENAIILTVNDSTKINLSNYYTSTNGYKEGEINYTLSELSGTETNYLSLKISDVYNNKTEESFKLTLDQNSFAIKIDELYPNPVEDLLSIEATHNRIGKNLSFDLSFFNSNGQRIFQETKECYSCSKMIRFGTNVDLFLRTNGKYFYKITGSNLENNEQTAASGPLLFWK